MKERFKMTLNVLARIIFLLFCGALPIIIMCLIFPINQWVHETSGAVSVGVIFGVIFVIGLVAGSSIYWVITGKNVTGDFL